MAEENSSPIDAKPLDANNRLKARVRATVPPRETSVLKRQADEEVAEEQEPSVGPVPTKPQLASQTGATSKGQKLVPFTLRVEETVDKGLKSLCTAENITKETFLEAAYLVCLENEQMMQQVLKVATERRQNRRDAGLLKRAKAMSRYLQEP